MEILRVKRGGCTTTTRDKTLVANFREEKTKQKNLCLHLQIPLTFGSIEISCKSSHVSSLSRQGNNIEKNKVNSSKKKNFKK